jgi:hypothetical protein
LLVLVRRGKGAERVSAPRGSFRQDTGVDEACLQVLEILGERRGVEQLVDDGEEVLEASNGLQVVGVGAKGSTCESEEEGVVDDVEANAAAIEGESGAAVLSEDAAEGSGQGAVVVEHLCDVSGLRGGHVTSGSAAWM